jgi:hypothetical protein
MTSEEVIKLVLETTGVKGLEELATQAFETAKALAEVGEKAEEVKKKTIDLQALATSGQGLFSAFQTGEIPGIIKGVGEMVDLVPALNTFAPAIKKIGEVTEYAWPLMKQLYEVWKEPITPIVTATEKIVDYGTRLNELGKEVKTFTDRTAAENVQLEREAKALEATVKWTEQLNALKSTATDEADAEIQRQNKLRAEKLKAAVGGQQEDIIEELSLQRKAKELDEVTKKYDEMTRAALRDPDSMDPKQADKLFARMEALKKGVPVDIQTQAREDVAKALVGGGEKNVADLAEQLDKKGKFRGKILDNADLSDEEMMSPKAKKTRDAAAKASKALDELIDKGLERDRGQDTKEGIAATQKAGADLQKGIAEAHRIGDAIEKALQQKAPAAPKLQKISPETSFREFQTMNFQNQIQLDQMMRDDRASLRALAQQTRSNIQQSRTNQSNGNN